MLLTLYSEMGNMGKYPTHCGKRYLVKNAKNAVLTGMNRRRRGNDGE